MPQSYQFKANYSPANNQLLEESQSLIKSLIPGAVKAYYNLLMSTEETAKYLTTEVVEKKLQSALSEWLESVLSPHSEDEFDALIERQKQIGSVHARINIEMHLVSKAMLVLKENLHKGLLKQPKINNHLIILIHRILDFALININHVYFKDHSEIEHQSHILKTHLSSMEFALEVEQMRTELQEWLTEGLINQRLTNFSNTDFAIWVEHKLSILIDNTANYNAIKAKVDALTAISKLPSFTLKTQIHETKQLIKDISWHLQEISKDLVAATEKKDPLTKLFNRRFLDSILLQETLHALRLKKPYSLAMLDIDFFKQVNDTHGHTQGDTVLKEVGTIIDERLRITDFGFRYGGEEFLIILTECNSLQAFEIMELIRNQVASLNFNSDSKHNFKVTVSVGICEFDSQPDYQHTINKADKALYQSKQNGRNRTTIWED